MKKRLNILILFMLLSAFWTTIGSVHAGSGSWADDYGGQANGLTWIQYYDSSGVRWYDGYAHTYRTNGNAPYYIYVKVSNWTDCDYPHYISTTYNQTNYAQSLTVHTLAGSNQCPATIRAEGRHTIQVFPGTRNVGGTTSEQRSIP